MRIAVALPSLEASAPIRGSLDSMLAALVAAGTEVEGFAEHDRLSQGDGFPVYHYLRMRERHIAGRFDLALYPLGRDASPYQGVFALMCAYPSVVWVLDPVIHHLAVGGIALLDKWADYRGMLDAAYGDEGAAIAQTTASYWGTGGFFRRYDLLAAVAGAQPGVLAAWPSLAERVSSRMEGRAVGVAPLGMAEPPTVVASPGATASRSLAEVAVMTVNESYPKTAVNAAAAALAADSDASVTICLSEPIYRAAGLPAAQRLGIEDRIQWELTTSPRRLSEVASSAGTLLWLADELQGGHRMLLLEGLAAGKVTMVPDCPLYGDLPHGSVVKLDLGRPLGPTFAETLRVLREEPALGAGLSQNGRAFASDCPGIVESAAILMGELRRLADACAPRSVAVAGATWERVAGDMKDAAVPGGADEQVRHFIDTILDAQVAGATRNGSPSG